MKYIVFNTINQNVKVNLLINDLLIRYPLLNLKETDLKQVGEYSFICINETINNQIIENEKLNLNQVNIIYQISLLETKINHTDNLINNIHILQTNDKNNYLIPSNQTDEKSYGISFDLYNYNMYYVNKMVESKDNLDLITSYKNQIIKNLNDIIIKYKIITSDINKNIISLLYVQYDIEDYDDECEYNDFLQEIQETFEDDEDEDDDETEDETEERIDYLIKYFIKDYDIKDKNKYYKEIKEYEDNYVINHSYIELYEIVNKDLQQILIQNKDNIKCKSFKIFELKINKNIYNKIKFELHNLDCICDRMLNYGIDDEDIDNEYLHYNHIMPLPYTFNRIIKDNVRLTDEDFCKVDKFMLNTINININDIIYYRYIKL